MQYVVYQYNSSVRRTVLVYRYSPIPVGAGRRSRKSCTVQPCKKPSPSQPCLLRRIFYHYVVPRPHKKFKQQHYRYRTPYRTVVRRTTQQEFVIRENFEYIFLKSIHTTYFKIIQEEQTTETYSRYRRSIHVYAVIRLQSENLYKTHQIAYYDEAPRTTSS